MRREGQGMWFGWKRFGLAAGLALCAAAAMAQRPAYQPAPKTTPAAAEPRAAAAASTLAATEIHVDQRCRILPNSSTLPSGKKAHPRSDWNTCHLESVFDTKHRVQTVVGSELQRSDVEIFEQQYVLGNRSQQPEVFMIEQPALKGWTIEGDPPPFRVADGKEFYRAWVQPGETVRLHVGMRKMTPLKPKVLKVKVRTSVATVPNAPPLVGTIRVPASGIPPPPQVQPSEGAPGPQ